MKIRVGNSKWYSETGTRMDASYHLSEGRQAKITIENSPHPVVSLGKLTKDIFNGPRFKRYYVNKPEYGVPFMGSSDMLKSDFSGLKYISKKYSKNLSKLYVEKGWTLVSCSGTIGNTIYTNEEFVGKTASQHVIRVVPNENILSGYLYAFLTSKYGYALLTQGTHGAVIQHIEPHNIADLPIPILPENIQQAIHERIEQAARLREEANRLLREAIDKIEKEYGIATQKKYIFKVNAKEIFKGDKFSNEKRLEADFYQPATENLVKKLKKGNWALLGDLSHEIHRSGLRERRYAKKGIPLFTGHTLDALYPDYSKQLSKTLTRNIEQNTTHPNDVIISILGTIGRVALAHKNFYVGVFASDHTARVRPNIELIHPGFIFLLLTSSIGQQQMQKFKTGAIIEWVKENNISSLVIPIPEDRGKRLGEIGYKICEMRQQALDLETQSITQLENEIASWQK